MEGPSAYPAFEEARALEDAVRQLRAVLDEEQAAARQLSQGIGSDGFAMCGGRKSAGASLYGSDGMAECDGGGRVYGGSSNVYGGGVESTVSEGGGSAGIRAGACGRGSNGSIVGVGSCGLDAFLRSVVVVDSGEEVVRRTLAAEVRSATRNMHTFPFLNA
eukprot:2105344-Pleurochrysis_carterae.AAC.1